jgi:hypothetical protein
MSSKVELKSYISEVIQLEKQEDELKQKMKYIKTKKDKLHNSVINYMSENNLTHKDILFEDSKISCTTVKTTESITKRLIFEKLKEFLKNEDIAEKATQHIYNDRAVTQKYALKISNKK